jgi:hypothetical protein
MVKLDLEKLIQWLEKNRFLIIKYIKEEKVKGLYQEQLNLYGVKSHQERRNFI